MEYIGNAFAVNMITADATIKIKNISKEEFVDAGRTAKSIVGHPEIAEKFNLPLNRESITLGEGDVLYTVSPSSRPMADKLVENGAKYEFVPESDGYVYKRILVYLED